MGVALGSLFHWDALAGMMALLVVFVGLCVASFSSRYLKGDRYYGRFFGRLALLLTSVVVMVGANHIVLLFAAWCASNALLALLMVHKPEWRAAKASGMLAGKYFLTGALFLAVGFALLYQIYGTFDIQVLLFSSSVASSGMLLTVALGFILVGCLIQSGVWPFHRWLISSLNAPTPVSALMHAGLVNAGGYVLTRFAPLYLSQTDWLGVMSLVGALTAMVGIGWKLIQSDVKRMLACSTMGQMGFMLIQCGLGLFPAAMTHVIWHGVFKAYLFLASGAAAQEKRLDLGYPPSIAEFLLACVAGILGAFVFAWSSGKLSADMLHHMTTIWVLLVVVAATGAQFALPFMQQPSRFVSSMMGMTLTALLGGCYGASVSWMTHLLAPLNMMQPQPLNLMHIFVVAGLLMLWLAVLFLRQQKPAAWLQQLRDRAYVMALNGSQPHPETMTTYRNHYQA